MRGAILRDGVTIHDAELPDLLARWRQQGGTLWLRIRNQPDALPTVQQAFGFDPRSIADCRVPNSRPALRGHGTYSFVVLTAPALTPHRREAGVAESNGRMAQLSIPLHEVDFFVGSDYLVTFEHGDIPSVEAVWRRLTPGTAAATGTSHGLADNTTPASPAGQTPDRLLATLAEEMLVHYIHRLDAVDGLAVRLESTLLQGGEEWETRKPPGPDTLQEIFRLRRQLVAVRRAIAPVRDVLSTLSRREMPGVTPGGRTLFVDLYDRSLRVLELLDNLRDLLAGLVEVYLTVQGNHMNTIMKTLTVIATVVLPLNLISGLMGMNVDLPLHGPWGFWIVIGTMSAVAGTFLALFRRRKWL